MKRVMIIGGSGSGKSTLARTLGAHLDLPVYHMDRIHWLPGWKTRPRHERREMALAVETQDQWIFEGSFKGTNEHRAQRADTLIWLDLPVGLRLLRVTKRLFRNKGQTRPDMAPGCTEEIGFHTLQFYIWIMSTAKSGRWPIRDLVEKNRATTDIIHLRAPADVDRWLMERGIALDLS